MGSILDDLTALVNADLSSCDAGELAALGRTCRGIANWLQGFDVRLAKAVARSTDATNADVFAGRGRNETNRALDRAELTDRMPELGEALEHGEISGAHVDALTRKTRQLDAAARAALAEQGRELADAARHETPEQFAGTVDDAVARLSEQAGIDRNERLRRDRHVRRWKDHVSGACNTTLSLDPETDARLWSTIDAITAVAKQQPQAPDTSFPQLQVDALVSHICDRATTAVEPDRVLPTRGGRPIDPYLRRVPQVSVLIDAETLLHGRSDTSTCEYADGRPLPVESVRRLCCEADILPVVLSGSGVVLDLGRARRVASPQQRQALEAMYATCSHPDCSVPVTQCEMHHVLPWEHGGDSDLANLAPLCSAHHHAVHEGRWRLELFADRRMIWSRPDGTVFFDGSTVDRRAISSRAA